MRVESKPKYSQLRLATTCVYHELPVIFWICREEEHTALAGLISWNVGALGTFVGHASVLFPITCERNETVQNHKDKVSDGHAPVETSQVVAPVCCQKQDGRYLCCRRRKRICELHIETLTE